MKIKDIIPILESIQPLEDTLPIKNIAIQD
jgi:hypothetical protein